MPLDPQHPATQQEALDQIARGGVVVYWRPGCPFCEGLAAGLGDDGDRAVWTNIWRDGSARDYVESLNGGNATVPTVVTRDAHFVAADGDSVERVRALLSASRSTEVSSR